MNAIDRTTILKKVKELAREEYIDKDDVPPIEKAILQLPCRQITLKGIWKINEKGNFVCNRCGAVVHKRTKFCEQCGSYMGE